MDGYDKRISENENHNIGRKKQNREAKYREIAYDIAGKIAAGEVKENEVIYMKSNVASQYGVSSETARRAMSILSDYGILEITKGSGVKIVSREKAIDFVRNLGHFKSFSELKKDLEEEISIRMENRMHIVKILEQLSEKMKYFRFENPFVPYEAHIKNNCPQIGKTLMETRFWNVTSATVVAIGRNGELLLSPGPDAIILLGDVVYYIGESNCVEKVNSFLKC